MSQTTASQDTAHNNQPTPDKSTDGARHSIQTIVGAKQARNRIIADQAGSLSTVTWTDAVHEVTLTVVQEANATPANAVYGSVGFCFDAPNDAVATAWLTVADSLASDSNLYAVPAGETRTFYFSGDGITRLDAIRLYGAEEFTVLVEAA